MEEPLTPLQCLFVRKIDYWDNIPIKHSRWSGSTSRVVLLHGHKERCTHRGNHVTAKTESFFCTHIHVHLPVDTCAVPLTLERLTLPVVPAVWTAIRPWHEDTLTCPVDVMCAPDEYSAPIVTDGSPPPVALIFTLAPLMSLAQTFVET